MGGRGSAGGNSRGGAAGGGVMSRKEKEKYLLQNSNMSSKEVKIYLDNEERADRIEKELIIEMSSTEDRHSVNWRRQQQEEINRLRNENSRLRYR